MKTLLVPCDFSSEATNAFRFALDCATRSKGTVHLLHVLQLPPVPNTVLTPVRPLGTSGLKELKRNAEESFGKLISRYGQDVVNTGKTLFWTYVIKKERP